MDYEREAGRIKGHRTTRLMAVNFAKKMVPVLEQARKEVPGRNGEPASMKGLADWLNRQKIPTRRGKTWRSETVSRLLDSPIAWTEEIEKEYVILAGARAQILKNKNSERREEKISELADIEQQRESSIVEMQKLSAALRDRPYVENTIPPPLSSSLVQRRVKRPPIGKQLSLFPELP